MGNLKSCFIVATLSLAAACGSDKAKPDAPIVIIDAPIDTPPPVDAPPDAPSYDFSCFGQPNPTTAADPITVAGTTETLSQSGLMTLPGVTVGIYKTGVVAPLDTQTSANDGTFTSGNIVTAGMPFNGYIKGTLANYRTSYLYPPNPAVASLANVPVALFDETTFGLLATQVAHVTQDDTANGALFLTVTDCANMPIQGATLSVKQGGQDVGTQFDLGALSQQAQGIIIVFNVPDGATDVTGTYGSMTFPTHTVIAHKKGNGQNATGTVTLTTVRPGP